MSRFLLATAAAACVVSAISLPARPVYAEMPDRDPAVHDLRERFESAHVPSIEELRLGHPWTCTYHSSIPGSHEVDTFPYYFMFSAGEREGEVRNDSFQAPVFRFAETALLGEYANNGSAFSIDHVRAEADGALLAEFTLPRCSGIACLFFGWVQLRGVDDYWEAVNGYRECPAN